jgi:hypothetical protein
MRIDVTVSELSERQQAMVAKLIADENASRHMAHKQEVTTLGEWIADEARSAFEGRFNEVDRASGELRKMLWAKADDEKRAQVDAILGIGG